MNYLILILFFLINIVNLSEQGYNELIKNHSNVYQFYSLNDIKEFEKGKNLTLSFNNLLIRKSRKSKIRSSKSFCNFNCTCLFINSDSDLPLTLIKNNCLFVKFDDTISLRKKNLFNYLPRNLIDLKYINLTHHDFRDLNENFFITNNSLYIEKLILNDNQIIELPNLKSFNESLIILNLKNNFLTNLNSSDFTLRNLKQINLKNNKIRYINKVFFDSICFQLKKIDLSYNNLKSLNKLLFNSCKKLEVLKINNNQLKIIHRNAFYSLNSLIKLDLNSNQLIKLSSVHFKSLISLKFLDLSANSLNNSITNGVFKFLNNLLTLNLNENSLVSLEENFMKGLKKLKLLQMSGNEIFSINTNWYESINLENLYLEHNSISKLTKSTFYGLISLKKLYLDYNFIFEIDKNTFDTNKNLIWLFLNENNLNVTIEKNKKLFSSDSLINLALGKNYLEYVPKTMFDDLPNLIAIDLSSNPIKYIEENALINLKKLDELNFDSTNLICDCKMRWFVNYYQEKLIDNMYLEDVACNEPKNLKKKLLVDLGKNFFLCKNEYTHEFLNDPKSQSVFENKPFSLNCQVISNIDLDTDIVFEWRKNNQIFSLSEEINVKEILTLEKDNDFFKNHKYIYSSNLRFLNSSIKDSGDYQCFANNSFLPLQSEIAKIKINKPSSIVTYKENSVSSLNNIDKFEKLEILVGKTLTLNCTVKNKLKPLIFWKKNDVLITKNLDERYFFENNDQVLFIVNVKKEDSGFYKCFIKNETGKLYSQIQVNVLSLLELKIKNILKSWFLVLAIVLAFILFIVLLKLISFIIIKKLIKSFLVTKVEKKDAKPKIKITKPLNDKLNKSIKNDEVLPHLRQQNLNLLIVPGQYNFIKTWLINLANYHYEIRKV